MSALHLFQSFNKSYHTKSNPPKNIWGSISVHCCIKNLCNILIIWVGFKNQGRCDIMHFWKGEQNCCHSFSGLKGLDREAGQGLYKRKRVRGTFYCDNHLAKEQEWLEEKVAQSIYRRMAASMAWEWVDCSGMRHKGQNRGKLLHHRLKLRAVKMFLGWMEPLCSKMEQPNLSLNLAVWKLPVFTEILTLPYFQSYWKHPLFKQQFGQCAYILLI